MQDLDYHLPQERRITGESGSVPGPNSAQLNS